MSDGNFNRALLPHTPYHSGLQVGRQQMRAQALDKLREILCTYPSIGPEERSAILRELETSLKIK